MYENPLAGIPSFGPFSMNEDEFDAAVQAAIARIPAKIRAEMVNVAIFTAENYEPGPHEDPHTVLLGLYEGTPLTERDSWWDTGSLPDSITVFRGPILEICSSREQVVHEISVTVVHEIAHHFGINDERLHELGWG
ncbi:metallopeptidase family protein [Arthrobacter sp. H35-D1]|uniref:metallopeptidase family protein n=1 Tax=Arthrobacter sp. H35-D1 TaxID=3046202 RepID=UPI0024B87A7F|nr:metallopeptidase family protein [Arthrobacter sp. H35-D1]MDJ0312271.1 metallopeptidase family protein [Arthrobacter sp. H35-D1]